jgi:hypothetical protein
VSVPLCTGLLDLIEEKESLKTPNFAQKGRKPFQKKEKF